MRNVFSAGSFLSHYLTEVTNDLNHFSDSHSTSTLFEAYLFPQTQVTPYLLDVPNSLCI